MGGSANFRNKVHRTFDPRNNSTPVKLAFNRQASKQLGLRLSGNCSEPGIYIVDIQESSAIAVDGRLQKFDRLLFVNGQDVRHCRINQASALIQVRSS